MQSLAIQVIVRCINHESIIMRVDRAAIYEAAKKLSNWGRWGADDQIGTLTM